MSQRQPFPLDWDLYFMAIAVITALRSKDPRSKVGAVIVDPSSHIVGTGYNGFVKGADENLFSWNQEGPWLNTKYPFVVHAEQNAVLNSTVESLRNCRIYTTLYPCHDCAKTIAQKGIQEVIFLSDHFSDRESRTAASLIFTSVNIQTRRLVGSPLKDIFSILPDAIFPPHKE